MVIILDITYNFLAQIIKTQNILEIAIYIIYHPNFLSRAEIRTFSPMMIKFT